MSWPKESRQCPIPDDLTVEKIRESIPKKLFEQNTLTSFRYLFQDLIEVAVWTYFTVYLLFPLKDTLADSFGYYPGLVVNILAWNLYWWVQGTIWTGIWVIAHECGHGSFSPSSLVNEIVGWILHSALLVPYHNWRLTHAAHHRHTNHTERDTVFIPAKRESPLKEAVQESPIVSLFFIVMMVTLGWPFHLFFNFAGNDTFGNQRVNHFEPSSPLFRKTDYSSVVKGNIGLAIGVGCIYVACNKFGAMNVLFWYGVPYLWTNFWLVLITFLQHTDPRIPHYSPENFTFVKGALATVDRDYGWYLNTVMHHIQDSHVAHHLYSTMPHYHAIQVTEKYLPSILGKSHIVDKRSIWAMLWEAWRQCGYIVPSEGVAFFYR